MSDKPLRVGIMIYGFAGGRFGRDSYSMKRIEAIGADWVIARNEAGEPEFFWGDPEELTAYTLDNSDDEM